MTVKITPYRVELAAFRRRKSRFMYSLGSIGLIFFILVVAPAYMLLVFTRMLRSENKNTLDWWSISYDTKSQLKQESNTVVPFVHKGPGVSTMHSEHAGSITYNTKSPLKPLSNSSVPLTDRSPDILSMYGEHAAANSFPKLPKWLQDYFIWHKSERKKANAQYVVISCLGKDQCGGFSDRLRDLPFLLLVAARLSRVVCIFWSRPFQLDTYMLPTETGIDWRCPKQFDDLVVKDRNHRSQAYKIYSFAGQNKDEGFGSLVSDNIDSIKSDAFNETYIGVRLFTKDYAKVNRALKLFNGQSYDTLMPEIVSWSHVDLTEHMFRVLFKPVPSLALKVNQTMTHLGLRDKEFSSVHVRGRYPAQSLLRHVGGVEVAKRADKAGGIKFQDKRVNRYLTGIVTNAIECVHLLDPDHPVYFSSDMSDMTEAISSKGVTLKNGATVKPVALSREGEILHLEGVGRRHTAFDDFLPLMEDLLIMGASRCVSHGIGSFGAFGAALSGNRCRAIHRNYKGRSETCPNNRVDRRNITITSDFLLKGENATGLGKIAYGSDYAQFSNS